MLNTLEKSPTKLVILARREIGPSHGTGQQLLLLKRFAGVPVEHLGWGVPKGIAPEYRPDFELKSELSQRYLLKRGKGLIARLERLVGCNFNSERSMNRASRWFLAQQPNNALLVMAASESETDFINRLRDERRSRARVRR